MFLMRDKFEAYAVFKRFHQMISNVFQASIHVLRIDNGKEYLSNYFSYYLVKHDIIHQSSCPYNPQQNRVAEGKNRHLLETARALMFKSLVPNSYWGEVVLTSSYLINRLPSKVLGFKTPLSVLLDFYAHYTRVLNSLSPKLFGYTVLVYKHQPFESKLELKALKCILIGYSPTQQGYKCYHLPTRKSIISCDVSFLENQLFFHTTSLQGQVPNAKEQRDSTLSFPMISNSETALVNESTLEPQNLIQFSVPNLGGG